MQDGVRREECLIWLTMNFMMTCAVWFSPHEFRGVSQLSGDTSASPEISHYYALLHITEGDDGADCAVPRFK